MSKLSPCLWFDGQAEEAAEFYTKLLPDSHIDNVSRATADNPSGKKGDVLTVNFTLRGVPFVGLNGGPDFKFSEAISFVIDCDDQAEVDRYWDALVEGGGEHGPCGWLKDRFGLSWQVVPKQLYEVLGGPDPAGAQRAMEAMLQMSKLDVAALEAAYAGRRRSALANRPPAASGFDRFDRGYRKGGPADHGRHFFVVDKERPRASARGRVVELPGHAHRLAQRDGIRIGASGIGMQIEHHLLERAILRDKELAGPIEPGRLEREAAGLPSADPLRVQLRGSPAPNDAGVDRDRLIAEAGQRGFALDRREVSHIRRQGGARWSGGPEPDFTVRVGAGDPAMLDDLFVDGLAGHCELLVEGEDLIPRVAVGLDWSIHHKELLAGLQERLEDD